MGEWPYDRGKTVHVKRCARRHNMYIIASLKHAGTSTTKDQLSIIEFFFAFPVGKSLFFFFNLLFRQDGESNFGKKK
jgi:hypothetical protein